MAYVRASLWAAGHDESVEVNQRALIDKVLARYSGEFTVFRELLQNSDDASSSAVEIHFESKQFLDKQEETAADAPVTTDGDVDKLGDLKSAIMHQWTFKNDGIIFRDEDWSRLKKIAEGNPDEEKIGAFGVGFYSLFSVTEEPFVTSGDQWMGFYWKDGKDQLFARRGKLPEGRHSRWTTFSMPLREPGPPPIPFDFIRFLASSITFMTHLSEVSVFLDGRRLARLKKDRGMPRSISLRKGLKSETAKGTMRITGVNVTTLHIKAEVMQWVYVAGSSMNQRKRVLAVEQQQARKTVTSGFFSSLFSSFSGTPQRTPSPMHPIPPLNLEEIESEEQKRLLTVNELNVTLAVFSADVEVRLDDHMKKELLRATKKNPPTHMKYELIYTGKEEYDASKTEDDRSPAGTGSIFQGLRADVDGTGTARIFIGHSTGQTTGIGGHMSARFIPTVERESIDFIDRNVRVWNEELLGVGGYLARTAYEEEMDKISALWPEGDPSSALHDAAGELRSKLYARALHTMKFFTFYLSTPAAQVSGLLEEAFFSCATSSSALSFIMGEPSTSPFPIISTVGIRPASEVRMPNSAFTEFLKQLPVIPAEIVESAGAMVTTLQARDMIKDITFSDVLKELRARPLPEAEMIACFKWWIDLYKSGAAKQTERARGELLNAAIVICGTSAAEDEKIVPLSTVKSFVNNRAAYIPLDGPLPSYLLPSSISRHFDPQWLKAAFGWNEFQLPEWLHHVLDIQVRASDPEHDITLSATWAERVLQVLTRAWPSSSKATQQAVVDLLKEVPCVPTTAGMRVPAEAYFQNAHVFPDLPLAKLPSGVLIKGTLEKVLEALGVRKHVELQIVFNRMIKTGDWSTIDLIKYLVAVQTTLSDEELERLKLTAAFPREQRNERQDQIQSNTAKLERYRASQLFEPLDVFRKLGLPVLDWGQNKWKASTEEARFLFRLGLTRWPPLNTVLSIAASQNEEARSNALRYFLDNHSNRYAAYNSADFADLAFIPALRNGKPCLAKPNEVFARPEWSSLGFSIVSPELSQEDLVKLGIPDHPSSTLLVKLLTNTPPDDEEVAKQWFTLMAGHVTEFSPAQLQVLSQALIVPIKSGIDKTLQLKAPRQCYFRSRTDVQQLHSKLFTFVDFGLTANQFLSACGTKREPTVEEVAQILLEDPRRFYEMAQGKDNFLTELRNIAINRRLLSGTTVARLKRSSAFLGVRRVRRAKKLSEDVDEEEDWSYEYDLLPAEKIVIADDTNGYQLFGDATFSCPQEDLLEDFYQEFGSRRLSSLIKDDYKTTTEIKNSKKAQEIRSLILERLPLFLHEHTHTQTRVPYSWLNQDKNFVVRTFGKLTVVKSLKHDQLLVMKNQDASAVAFRDGRGPIQLWLAGNDSVDMFEVSTSLCRLLFEHPRASDALLFMTILSTDLKSLKRRGYNVDRILQRQRAQRQAADNLAREALREAERSTQLSSKSADHSVPHPSPEILGQDDRALSVSDSSSTTFPQDSTRSTFRSSIDNWRKKFTSKPGPSSLGATPSGNVPESNPIDQPSDGLHDVHSGEVLREPPRASSSRPVTPGPTPMRNIAANIDVAIRACREEKSDLFRSKTQDVMRPVKESVSDAYCDASGQALDLVYVGDMGGIKIFFSRDVQQPKAVMASKKEAIARFVHIIRPLGEVYNLPPSSLHIFYDLSGGTIAFNRNASLFCNLRFFEAWHDSQVDGGHMAEAYTSWYFTLAHEIAHNLVQPHNAEHEFWFSAICERHVPPFTRLLGSLPRAVQSP